MRKTDLLFMLGAILVVTLSCRMVETLTGNESAGTVNTLWPDVPPMEGATRADLAIPLGARLLIRAAMQGKVNFISFTTSKTAQEVQDFYSKQRMKSAGWTASEKGCVSDTEDKQSQGAVCLFNRKDQAKKEGLAIVMAQDEKTKQTDIFYARVDLTEPAAASSP